MPVSPTTSMAVPPAQAWQVAVQASEFGILPLVMAGVMQRYAPHTPAKFEDVVWNTALDTTLRIMIGSWAVALGVHPVAAYPVKDSLWKALAEGKDRWRQLADVPLGVPIVLLNRDNGKIFVWNDFNGERTVNLELRDALYAQADSGSFNRPTRVRASSVDGCQRATFFDIAGFPETNIAEDNPHWRVSAAIGTAIHNLLEDILDTVSLPSETEYTVEVPGVFGGKVDGRVFVNGEWVLLDWKTVGAADFRQGAGLYKIKKYFAQLSSYAAVEGINKAVVILINRNNGAMQELELILDPAYGQSLLRRAEDTMTLVRTRTVPVADKLFSSDCRFCRFQRQCGEEEATGYIQRQLDAGVPPVRL